MKSTQFRSKVKLASFAALCGLWVALAITSSIRVANWRLVNATYSRWIPLMKLPQNFAFQNPMFYVWTVMFGWLFYRDRDLPFKSKNNCMLAIISVIIGFAIVSLRAYLKMGSLEFITANKYQGVISMICLSGYALATYVLCRTTCSLWRKVSFHRTVEEGPFSKTERMDKITNSAHFKVFSTCLQSSLLVCIILLVLFILKGYAPFGMSSLAAMDGNITYGDMLAYLRNVLIGKDDIIYTMQNTLGGPMLANVLAFLSSPVNLLLIFFKQEDIYAFFDIAILLKLAFAATTCAYFVQKRFPRLKMHMIICLALSYALMQYSIAQCSNIMWLDGVYMLPLMLLGVYELLRDGSIILLSLSSAFAILFNWYSAGINCLFTVFWFILEVTLHWFSSNDNNLKTYLTLSCRYIIAMLISVGTTSVLWLPTLLSLRHGRGHIDWWLMRDGLNGNPLSTIQNFVLGSVSSNNSVSLFCGSFVLLGCLSFFTSKNVDKFKKVVLGIALFWGIMLFYWQPIYFIFSLLKDVSSYWFRFSYITIFLLVFIAAHFYSDVTIGKDTSLLFLNALFIGFVFFAMAWINPIGDLKLTWRSFIFALCIAGSTYISLYCNKCQNSSMYYRCSVVILLLAVCSELFYNTILLTDRYHMNDVATYRDYVDKTSHQIAVIKKMDNTNYRISQTTTRRTSRENLTVNYNDSFAYTYSSISGYTSDPDYRKLTFLDQLGYRRNGENFGIVNTSIVPADSLLGVKYIMSPYSIKGLQKLDKLPHNYQKAIYYNPYVLPMALTFPTKAYTPTKALNPFEYQMDLFSQLAGRKVRFYQPLPYTRKIVGKNIQYTISVPKGQVSLYGNIPWNKQMNALLHIGDFLQGYSRWASPSVFYIPTTTNHSSVTIALEAKNDLAVREEQFYALDLLEFEKVTREITRRPRPKLKLKNGYITCDVDSSCGQSLFLSVPYHEGWQITLNGKPTEIILLGNCLFTVPLKDGRNHIVMRFVTPGLKNGFIISLLTIITFFAVIVYDKIRSYSSQDRRNV